MLYGVRSVSVPDSDGLIGDVTSNGLTRYKFEHPGPGGHGFHCVSLCTSDSSDVPNTLMIPPAFVRAAENRLK